MIKNVPANAGDLRRGFNPWVGMIPWRRAWRSTPVTLPGESHGQRSLAATVHRVRKSQTQLKRLSMHALKVHSVNQRGLVRRCLADLTMAGIFQCSPSSLTSYSIALGTSTYTTSLNIVGSLKNLQLLTVQGKNSLFSNEEENPKEGKQVF